MSLDFDLHLSLSSSSESDSFEVQEPPNKKRKLNTSKIENKNTVNSHHVRRKRKLPSLVARNYNRVIHKNKNKASTTGKKRKRFEPKKHKPNHSYNCNTSPEVDYQQNDNIHASQWNNIASTSLTTVFEYVNIKYLYLNASIVCRYWHSTISEARSDFIFGYYRKTMHRNPSQPMALIQLKTYNVPYIKQELKARKLRVQGRKSELIKRLYIDIQKDGLPQNVNNKQSVQNRKRLILFQMKKLFDNVLFCNNCHMDWTQYWQKNKKSLVKKDIMKRLSSIHQNLNICLKCQNLKEYQDVNREHALKYYGLNENDFIKCGIVLKRGRGQQVNMIATFHDDYTNAYVAEQIAKIKYGETFRRRTIKQEKEFAKKAKGLLQKGQRQKYVQIYAPDIDYIVNRKRFECNEILYNATLLCDA